MARIETVDALKIKLTKMWDDGKILRMMTEAENYDVVLRCGINLPVEKALIAKQPSIVMKWAEVWRKGGVKTEKTWGYRLNEKKTKIPGWNSYSQIPVSVEVSTIEDAIFLINKQESAKEFRHWYNVFTDEFPVLRDWLREHPKELLQNIEWSQEILSTCRYFSLHPRPNDYLRNLPIEGTDTKFIEKHRAIVQKFLEKILPQASLTESDDFYVRFGLKRKPWQIQVRFLDESLFLQGISEFAISPEQLNRLSTAAGNVFITENAVTGYAFPEQKNSMILFGEGNGIIEVFAKVKWLRKKRIYYWGDIDTYGFQILSNLRGKIPSVRSFLMDEHTFTKYKYLCVEEDQQVEKLPLYLSEEEERMFLLLKRQMPTANRLEQERISAVDLKNALQQLAIK